jgi:hypothetical protein
MFNKNAIPIPNKHVVELINSTKTDATLSVYDTYINVFDRWIKSSKNNQLKNLDLYTNKKFICGTIQAFDHFYLKYNNLRFRFFQGEFMYHRASLKHNLKWEWLNTEPLVVGDALIISVPFSDTGSMHTELTLLLDKCEELSIPVLLDMAYYPITKNININLNYKCIDTICFSLSKAFDGAQWLRCGIRYQRYDNDDGIDIFNSVDMTPRIPMQLSIALMNNFSVDYNWDIYGERYKTVCETHNLQSTDCVIFGLGNNSFNEYNRGGIVNRVCISRLLEHAI